MQRGNGAGKLKLSMAPRFGMTEILPLMPEFLARYPAVSLDLQFDNGAVDEPSIALMLEDIDLAELAQC